MTVDYAVYCCSKDIDKLYENLSEHLGSHKYSFDNVHVIHQRVKPKELNSSYKVHHIREINYHNILAAYCINDNNTQAEEYTHGWGHSHYWKHHCVNHLKALIVSDTDYIVLSDADCHMSDGDGNMKPTDWIRPGIEMLKNDINVLVVSPNDGSKGGHTQNMSQQMFLCERARLAAIDFDLPFEGFREGGPMQEYYFMLEGRIGRYMEKNNLFRYVMNKHFRYWHKQWH